MKHWLLPAAARARGQSKDLNREILASNLFNCRKEVINTPPVRSISRCIHIVYRHKNIWEYQWSNFIYECMSTFLHYARCKDALLDCSAPGGERCESLTGVDEIWCKCLLVCTKTIIWPWQEFRCIPPFMWHWQNISGKEETVLLEQFRVLYFATLATFQEWLSQYNVKSKNDKKKKSAWYFMGNHFKILLDISFVSLNMYHWQYRVTLLHLILSISQFYSIFFPVSAHCDKSQNAILLKLTTVTLHAIFSYDWQYGMLAE